MSECSYPIPWSATRYGQPILTFPGLLVHPVFFDCQRPWSGAPSTARVWSVYERIDGIDGGRSLCVAFPRRCCCPCPRSMSPNTGLHGQVPGGYQGCRNRHGHCLQRFHGLAVISSSNGQHKRKSGVFCRRGEKGLMD